MKRFEPHFVVGQAECIKHQWIGAAHALDLNGPWIRLDTPVLTGNPTNWEGGMVANPSVVSLENGSLLMASKSQIRTSLPFFKMAPKSAFEMCLNPHQPRENDHNAICTKSPRK